METIAKIHANEEKLYPPRKDLGHTDLKLKALLRTHDNLDVAAPFMIVLIVVIVLRITCDVLARFPSPPDSGMDFLLPLVDLIIIVWLLLLFFVLGVVHVFARRDDIKVRRKTDEYIVAHLDKSETASDTPSSMPGEPALAKRRMYPFAVWGGLLLLAGLFGRGRKRVP
jgi:hypothetical protein